VAYIIKDAGGYITKDAGGKWRLISK